MVKSINSFDEILGAIKACDKFYLSGHTNPDGDSKGSCECLKLCLEDMGLLVSEIPAPNGANISDTIPNADCFIQVDVQPDYRLTKEAQEAKAKAQTTICFDHHLYEGSGCDFEYVEPEASACALIVWDFVKFTGVKITKEIATAAYFGLCSDTNSFMNTNTDERRFQAAT